MAEIILLLVVAVLIRRLLDRNMPRVGGKIGAWRPPTAAEPLPEGFASVALRDATVFVAAEQIAAQSTLRAFLRRGIGRHRTALRIYRVAGYGTDIEIPVGEPDYDRIDATDALALLRELPDPRLVRRLHLSDEPCFLDPWLRRLRGARVFLLGNAVKGGLVVLYRPDRRQRRTVAATLLHEWLHLVAFTSPSALRQFKHAAVEPMPAPAVEPVSYGLRSTTVHERWSELGEVLLGDDEAAARDVACAAPLHATILWRKVEALMRQTPPSLRSTRFAVLEARASFMRDVALPKGAAVR